MERPSWPSERSCRKRTRSSRVESCHPVLRRWVYRAAKPTPSRLVPRRASQCRYYT